MSFPGFPGPPGTGSPSPPSNHNLLSTTHADTIAATPVAGDIIVSPTGNLWERLPVGSELDHLVIIAGTPTWTSQAGSGLGDVTGPGISTDNGVARFSGPSGMVIQDSLVIINDFGDIFIGRNATVSGDLTVLGNIVGLDLAASGFVVGPATATDSAIALYDSTTGKLIKDSSITSNGSGLIIPGDVNIGGNTFISGDITVLGDITGNVFNTGILISTVASGTGPTFIITNQYFNAVTSSVTNVILPLNPVLGQRHIVKDIDGTAGSVNVTITPSGGYTIDGLATIDLVNNYEAINFIFGPTEWNLI